MSDDLTSWTTAAEPDVAEVVAGLGGWNPDAWLECLSCADRFPLGAMWQGCPSCDAAAPVVVTYGDLTVPSGIDQQAALDWLGQTLSPLREVPFIDLGLQETPLLALRGPAGRVHVKLEGRNPTGSHKDRFHRVAETVARFMGYTSVITASTGNHGAATSAYAAAGGMASLVLLNPEAPESVRVQIQAYGGCVAVLPHLVPEAIATAVDAGWYPSTSADPGLVGRGNPYGAEGYKAIAYEIVHRLGRAPGSVFVPAASGDLYFGIWKGFVELHRYLGLALPELFACQPAGAAPLVLTEEQHSDRPQRIEDATSLALSTRDDISGWHATWAIRHGGRAWAVPETQVLSEMVELARRGVATEPAGAVGLAGLRRAEAEGALPEGEAVAVVTSSGLNWMSDVERGLPPADLSVLRQYDPVRELIASRARN